MYFIRFLLLWLGAIVGLTIADLYFHGAVVSAPRIVFMVMAPAAAITLRRYLVNSGQR